MFGMCFKSDFRVTLVTQKQTNNRFKSKYKPIHIGNKGGMVYFLSFCFFLNSPANSFSLQSAFPHNSPFITFGRDNNTWGKNLV